MAKASEPKEHRGAGSFFVRAIIWLGVIGIFAGAFYLVLGHKEAPKKGGGGRRGFSGPVTLTTATAAKGDIGVYIDAIGTVTSEHTASIFSQVSGAVVSVDFKEGQLVNKGDPLVQIDDRQYKATLLQAQGTLQKDENVLAQAQMDLARYQAAWARNAVSKQTLDDQDKIVRQNEGLVKNDQGVVQFDQIQVDYCYITAPFTGSVGLRLVDPGNLVNSGTSTNGTPLVVITQLQPITVVFTIPEDNLGSVLTQLRKNAKLAVDVFDRSAQTKIATGELLAVDNQIDTTTGTVKVRSVFSNEDYALFPNQFVNTRLLVETLKDVTLIPSSCIQQNGATSFVYVIEDETAHMKEIKAGVSENGLTQVEGINPGDVLADSGFNKLQDGSKIIVATPGGGPDAAGGHKGPGGDAHPGGHGGHGGHKKDGKGKEGKGKGGEDESKGQ